jgi:60 kDa SS-A/Ro ribonucleoprotein
MSVKTMSSYIAAARKKKADMKGTAQTVKAHKDQVINSAGGAVFKLTPWQQLERFLILGTEGGTYYAGERELTIKNAKNVEDCVKEDGISVVDMIVDISKGNRAPKNDPALLALALCASTGDAETRGYAFAMLPEVARTATHLFHFTEFCQSVRGWGRLFRDGIANWYNRLDTNRLGLQVVKYQQRDGWSHRDLLRLSHPNPGEDAVRNNLYKYIVKGAGAIEQGSMMPQIVIAHEQAKTADTKTLAKLIIDNELPRECIPTEKLNDPAVWDALLVNMPLTAMIRNLGKMTNIGLLTPGAENTARVINALNDAAALKKARVHPFTVLLAMNQYRMGKGLKGSLVWNPIAQIIQGLDSAFYAAFGNVEPSGKRTLLSLDVSGSMHSSYLANTTVSVAMAAAAMSMVTMKTEQEWKLMGFGTSYKELEFNPSHKLDHILSKTRGMSFGGTDCSLPIIWANEKNLKFDTFIVYTDNETYAGDIHPYQAICKYREKTGINAKLIVVGMTSTGFTIANPMDPGMLDVVGFDSAGPQIIADFSANRF